VATWHTLSSASSCVSYARWRGITRVVVDRAVRDGAAIRVLFAFDPRRMAILLIGGDKSDRWSEFYEEMIPLADDLYDEHLDQLREEGEIP
jgi:hypothetical protein